MEIIDNISEDGFENCIKIISELTENQDVNELAFNLLNIVYAKGGDYSEKTLRAFAETYCRLFR